MVKSPTGQSLEGTSQTRIFKSSHDEDGFRNGEIPNIVNCVDGI
jgi:hypothetical protein